uniref:Uncharacterized protein n=1 Tax=Anguilla anguilla TaxID=7936 RepID=A0A0E9US73_ANGAN
MQRRSATPFSAVSVSVVTQLPAVFHRPQPPGCKKRAAPGCRGDARKDGDGRGWTPPATISPSSAPRGRTQNPSRTPLQPSGTQWK